MKSKAERNAEWARSRGHRLLPPRSLPYRALARSCDKCGGLITTPDFLLRRDTPYPRCRPCEVHRTVTRENRKEEILAAKRRAQLQTLGRASRYGFQWTGPELELISRRDLSMREMALMLGRSFHAVRNMRQKLKDDPRKASLAGTPHD